MRRRAYIVEDDAALRRTMVRMLSGAGVESEEFETAEEFLADYSNRPIGCVLLDVRLPGMDGLERLEQTAELDPANPIIMVSGFGDIPSAVRAVKMGALDFVQKPFRKEQLLDVLDKRERDVLAAFADGAPNKVVAHRLELSPRTVEMHRARIFKKLGVRNLPQALLRARTAGLIS